MLKLTTLHFRFISNLHHLSDTTCLTDTNENGLSIASLFFPCCCSPKPANYFSSFCMKWEPCTRTYLNIKLKWNEIRSCILDFLFNFDLSCFHQQKFIGVHSDFKSTDRCDTKLHWSKEDCLVTYSHVFLIAICIEKLHILWKIFWAAFYIANLNTVSVCNTCQKYKQEQTSDDVCIGCCPT